MHFQCTSYTGSYSSNTYCKRGMQQTLLFQTSRTYRSMKLTFSRRSLKAVVRSPCQAVTMTLTINVRMCIYINECSASLYPTVIKHIIKSDIYSLFCLKIKTRYFFKFKTILKNNYQFYFIFQLNYVGTYFAMTV